MSTYDELSDLSNELTKVIGWSEDFLPDPDDSARCFEFLVLLETALTLAQALKCPVIVRSGPKNKFAGAPGDRKLYNFLIVHEYHIYFGVGFSRRGRVWHYPDVTISHQTRPEIPILVIECKHYSASTLPRQIVMAFVGVLHDLEFAAFNGCRKLSITWSDEYGHRQPTQLQVLRESRVCEAFNLCRSRIVTSIPTSRPALELQSNHDFLIEVKTDEIPGAVTGYAG